MSAIERFNLSVSTATVTIMFAIIQYLLPMLQLSAIPAPLAQLFPAASPAQLVEASKFVLAALATLGTYKLLAKALIASIDRVPLMKSFIFGPSYMEGTWIGRFNADEPKWTVEHFEQALSGLVIRGVAYSEDNSLYGSWTSEAASIDYARGILTYTYDCHLTAQKNPQQGVAVFQFQRETLRKAPSAINGYSSDLVDGVRSPNYEVKISNSSIPVEEAMRLARERFPR